jgi:hypothetical protein
MSGQIDRITAQNKKLLSRNQLLESQTSEGLLLFNDCLKALKDQLKLKNKLMTQNEKIMALDFFV